jgi:hypothetical protein
MTYPRYLKTKLLQSISASPVVLLTGGRQTGKTTLVTEISKEKSFSFITLDNLRYLTAAREDPMGILESYKNPLIIDEVQRAPEIGLPIKQKVDENRHPGMYILTGSSNPLVAPKLNDSLAGRMFILHLWPLAQCEISGTQTSILEMLFAPEWHPGKTFRWSKEEMIQRLIKGGYPTVQNQSLAIQEDWFGNHIQTLLERDIYDLAQIRRTEELPSLLQLLANRSGSLLNISELSRSTKIPHATLTFYLTLLEAMYLIIRQPAWHKNATKRMTKAPKIYLTDPGIASFLIGADEKRLFSNPNLTGSLLETFVIMEIEKLLSWSSLRLQTFHYRTVSGIEVDLLLETKAGDVVGIEIKSSETIRGDDFKGLRTLKEELGTSFIRGIVLYPGDEVVPFGENLFAVPISALFRST